VDGRRAEESRKVTSLNNVAYLLAENKISLVLARKYAEKVWGFNGCFAVSSRSGVHVAFAGSPLQAQYASVHELTFQQNWQLARAA
jgi:hypothetical protein